MKKVGVMVFVLLALVVLGAFTIYGSPLIFKRFMTGFAVGTVNVSVQSSASINFTSSSISFGSGQITGGESYALLYSNNGSVVNGNWTGTSDGFLIENLGNVNVTLNISSAKSASTFLGGTSPEYKFMVTNSKEGSCNGSVSYTMKTWSNLSSSSLRICDLFDNFDSSDEIEIDIFIKIPLDSRKGTLSDTITLNYEVV